MKQYMIDLQREIESWQQGGNLLIIGGDWNEEVSTPAWHTFWNNLGLVTPRRSHTQSPVTYLFSRAPTIGYGLCFSLLL